MKKGCSPTRLVYNEPMPHIVIEYSVSLKPQLDITNVMQSCVQILTKSKQFDPSAIKARALSYSDVILAENVTDFVHVTLSIIEGRSVDIRRQLTQSVYRQLRTLIPQDSIVVTVDLKEINKATYCK